MNLTHRIFSLVYKHNTISILTAICSLLSWYGYFIYLVYAYDIREGFWIADPHDDYGNLWRQVQEITHNPPKQQNIYLLASSTIREGILHPQYLFEHLDPNTDIQLLTAGDLYPVEMAQIVSVLPQNTQTTDVFVLEVSMRNFALAPTTAQELIFASRLPNANPTYQKILLESGFFPPIVPNYHAFYSSRMEKEIPKENWVFHQIDFFETLSKEESLQTTTKLLHWARDTVLYGDQNRQLYENTIRTLPINSTILLLYPPRNPTIVEYAKQDLSYQLAESVLEEQLDLLEKNLRNQYNIHTIHVQHNLQESDFADYGHINNATAREEWSNGLLQEMQTILQR